MGILLSIGIVALIVVILVAMCLLAIDFVSWLIDKTDETFDPFD